MQSSASYTPSGDSLDLRAHEALRVLDQRPRRRPEVGDAVPVEQADQPPLGDVQAADHLPDVLREDSRGTKPARVTPLAVARTRYIKGREALRNKYGYVERSNEMRTAS